MPGGDFTRKTLCVVLTLLMCASGVRAGGATLREARTRLLRGNYAEARELYTELLVAGKDKMPATLGLSRVMQAEGEYDQALAVVDVAIKDAPKTADLLARRAELLYLRGRWGEAEKTAAQAIEIADDCFLARWVRGQLWRDRGELDKADDEFRWFVRTYSARSNADMEITDPDVLMLVALAGTERARYHNLTEQFTFILTEIYNHVAKTDKDYWWAEYHAGRLLAEKYNKRDTFKAFEKALAINPRAAEVLAEKGYASLQRFEIKDAEFFAQEALKINRNLAAALRLQADAHLFAGNVEAALKELAKARQINPREEATLARIAACHHAQRQTRDFDAIVREVEKHNAKPAIFYWELAERLEERRLFLEAEKYFKLAASLQPKLPWPQNSLGLLFMRLGQEDEARKTLEKAFEWDPFNVRVSNTLKVLDHLKGYQTLRTEHFHLLHDDKNDKVLAAFMAKYLEEIYAELADRFQYRPKGPILIEVFNKHEMFSGRVVALPDLHTIGACTGSVVAMVSPRDKSKVIGKPFNWVRVIRHELVHVFNLEQTKFQCPHWFTEGLAVTLEGTPPPPSWQQLLAEKFHDNQLMNLDNILLGFIRPNSSDEWHQAYCQSQLYIEYLTKTHGQRAIAGLLDAYRDGLETGAALERVCKVSKADFEKGYRKFIEERVKSSKIAAAPRGPGLKELKEAHAKDPNNIEVAAQLAERSLAVGDKNLARKLADEVLAAKPKQPLAAYVKARLLHAGGETNKAVELLRDAVDAKNPDVKVVKLLGKLQFEAKNFAEAAQMLELGRAAEPWDHTWAKELARVYLQTEERTKLIDVLKELVPTDADDLFTRRKLAQLLAQENRHAEAERFARMALEIDVLDPVAQQVLEKALQAQNKEEELRQLRELLK